MGFYVWSSTAAEDTLSPQGRTEVNLGGSFHVEELPAAPKSGSTKPNSISGWRQAHSCFIT